MSAGKGDAVRPFNRDKWEAGHEAIQWRGKPRICLPVFYNGQVGSLEMTEEQYRAWLKRSHSRWSVSIRRELARQNTTAARNRKANA